MAAPGKHTRTVSKASKRVKWREWEGECRFAQPEIDASNQDFKEF